jgi:hypothetical protein
MATGLSLDQFLGHSSSSSSRTEYLSKWKKNTPPRVDVWLHTKALIEPLWRHGVPRLFTRKDRTTGEETVEVWSGDWLCWEDESVLTKQYLRDNDTGERAYPPTICPICKLIEYVRSCVESGELSWVTPLFRYVGDDPGKAITINAGGIFNAFASDKLSESDIAELRQAKIFRSEAWRQNMMAKLSYAFSVVDNAHPGKGTQIAIETPLLGDKVKEVIHKAMLEAEDEGNPLSNPYAIRWMYNPDERQFNLKYNAAKMGKIPLTQEIKELIINSPPPDLSKIKARKDPQVLLTQLEAAFIPNKKFTIPWDEIFGDAITEWKAGDKSADFDPEQLEADDDEPKPRQVVARQSPAKQSKPEPELCYQCGEFLSNGKCSNCGWKKPTSKVATQNPDDDLPY